VPLVASYLASYVGANSDYLIGGQFLTPPSLASYYVAFNLAMIPMTRLSTAANRVMLPALGHTADVRLWSTKVAHYLRVSLLYSVGATVLLIGTARFIPVVFGAKWADAVPPVLILAAVAPVGVLRAAVGTMAFSVRRDAQAMVLGACSTMVPIVAFLSIRPSSPAGVAEVMAWTFLVTMLGWSAAIPEQARRACLPIIGAAIVISAGLLATEEFGFAQIAQSQGAALAAALAIALGVAAHYRQDVVHLVKSVRAASG
jgi:O-antigen/teichoic acid export membrane protein